MLLFIVIGLQVTSLLVGFLHYLASYLYGQVFDITATSIPTVLSNVPDAAPTTFSQHVHGAMATTDELIKRVSEWRFRDTLLPTFNVFSTLDDILNLLEAVDSLMKQEDADGHIGEICTLLGYALLSSECPIHTTTCSNRHPKLQRAAVWETSWNRFSLMERRLLEVNHRLHLLFTAVETIRNTVSLFVPLVDHRTRFRLTIRKPFSQSVLETRQIEEIVNSIIAYPDTLSKYVHGMASHLEDLEDDVRLIRQAVVLEALYRPFEREPDDMVLDAVVLSANEVCGRLGRRVDRTKAS